MLLSSPSKIGKDERIATVGYDHVRVLGPEGFYDPQDLVYFIATLYDEYFPFVAGKVD